MTTCIKFHLGIRKHIPESRRMGIRRRPTISQLLDADIEMNDEEGLNEGPKEHAVDLGECPRFLTLSIIWNLSASHLIRSTWWNCFAKYLFSEHCKLAGKTCRTDHKFIYILVLICKFSKYFLPNMFIIMHITSQIGAQQQNMRPF